MGNILGKSYRENQNSHFIFSNFFLKIAPFMRIPKHVVETGGHTWHIHVACWISKATYTYAHTYTHMLGYPLACMHAQTNK
jgi:hypothetical protein